MISVDGKGTVFPVKLKLQGESFEKTLIKRISKKVNNWDNKFNWDKSPD